MKVNFSLMNTLKTAEKLEHDLNEINLILILGNKLEAVKKILKILNNI